jgi:hypothetical protein
MRISAFHLTPVKEWGFDGVLLNAAVSRALDPIRMAGAFSNAVRGGRTAFLAGPMNVQEVAIASTPEIGRPFTPDLSAQHRTLAFEPNGILGKGQSNVCEEANISSNDPLR